MKITKLIILIAFLISNTIFSTELWIPRVDFEAVDAEVQARRPLATYQQGKQLADWAIQHNQHVIRTYDRTVQLWNQIKAHELAKPHFWTDDKLASYLESQSKLAEGVTDPATLNLISQYNQLYIRYFRNLQNDEIATSLIKALQEAKDQTSWGTSTHEDYWSIRNLTDSFNKAHNVTDMDDYLAKTDRQINQQKQELNRLQAEINVRLPKIEAPSVEQVAVTEPSLTVAAGLNQLASLPHPQAQAATTELDAMVTDLQSKEGNPTQFNAAAKTWIQRFRNTYGSFITTVRSNPTAMKVVLGLATALGAAGIVIGLVFGLEFGLDNPKKKNKQQPKPTTVAKDNTAQ